MEIDEIEWSRLTADDAIALRAKLRTALAKGDEWFAKLAEGFGASERRVVANPVPVALHGPVVGPVKRGRGRPKKAAAAVSASTEKHPPVGLLKGSYVSDAPDLSKSWTLPVGHPRAGGNIQVEPAGDADYAAMAAGKVEFN